MKDFDNSTYEKITDELRERVHFANYVANIMLDAKNYDGYTKALEEGNRYWSELQKAYKEWLNAIEKWYDAQR